MDIFLFEKINGLAGNFKILDYIGIFLAEYLLWIIVGILIILFLSKKTRLMATAAVGSVILGRLIITEIIKRLYFSSRPYIVLEGVKKLITENKDYQSFPSGHVVIFFSIATAIYLFNKKWGIISFVIAILVAIARIFVGVHWPSDILGGAVVGIFSGVLVRIIYLKTRVSRSSVRLR